MARESEPNANAKGREGVVERLDLLWNDTHLGLEGDAILVAREALLGEAPA